MKNESKQIQCANFRWRIFRKGGVYYADGRGHGHGRMSLNTKDFAEAMRLIVQLDQSVVEQNLTQIVGAETVNNEPQGRRVGISITEGWEHFLASRDDPDFLGGHAPSTKKKYRAMSNRFVAYCSAGGVTCWTMVDKRLLQQYCKKLQEDGLAPRTIHHELTMAISVSNALIFDGVIPETCKIRWRLNKPSRSERYCYTETEVQRMLEFANKNANTKCLGMLILVLSRTGLRLGEALKLRINDVDLKNNFVCVKDERFSRRRGLENDDRKLKDKNSRIIPIHPDLAEALAELPRRAGHVLLSPSGRPLNANWTRDRFIKLVIKKLESEFPSAKNEVGFKNGRLHSFRHYFVSQCFVAGIPETDIRDWVGHSSSVIVELYRHLRHDVARQNMNRVNFGHTTIMSRPVVDSRTS